MYRLDLLKKLCLANGISGFEEKISAIMKDELAEISDKVVKDNIGSVAFEFLGNDCKPKILVVAHQDEIGFIVSDITDSGLVKFHNIGGWDWRTLLSSPVNITNKEGNTIPGIIGSIPKHHLPAGESKSMDLSDMFIDIGAKNKEEVEKVYNIRIGDPVSPVCNFFYNETNNLLTAKAFDDRLGIAAIIELGKIFHTKNHPNLLICAGSVQEEVGIRGAQTLSELVKPDLAIVVEGVPADDFPGNESKAQSKLGKGVHIRLFDPTMIVNPAYRDFIVKLAQDFDIPYQVAVRKSGGTDAKVIHLSNVGVPTVVLGIPVRYAHSHNGIISMDDFNNLINLLELVISNLDSNQLEEILP